jgi:hypothetical protein
LSAPDLPEGVFAPVKRVIELLVAGRYDELAEHSSFFGAEDLRKWMGRWSAIPIAVPPDGRWDRTEAFPIEAYPGSWDVWVDLWDPEAEDIADLHVIVLVEESQPGVFHAQLREVLP